MDSLIGSGQLPAVLGILVAILAVLMPVAIVVAVLHYRHRRSMEVLAMVRQLSERGLPVPPGLLQQAEPARRRGDGRDDLKTALTLLGAGLGLMVFFYTSDMRIYWGLGALIAIIGVARLLAWWLTRQRLPQGADRNAV